MELRLVADTNLFFECRKLEELPWQELGHDPIVVLVSKPVLDEIDKHKKANGRTRDRAIDIFGRVRAMLQASQTEVVLRESGPRVLLRRLGHVQPNADFKEDLDYSRTDERLVGIASTLALEASDHRVVLFTDDSGPASTAASFGVEYLMIPRPGADRRRRPTSRSGLGSSSRTCPPIGRRSPASSSGTPRAPMGRMPSSSSGVWRRR